MVQELPCTTAARQFRQDLPYGGCFLGLRPLLEKRLPFVQIEAGYQAQGVAAFVGLAGLGDHAKRRKGSRTCPHDQGGHRFTQGPRRPGCQPGQIIKEWADRNGQFLECLHRQASLDRGAIVKGSSDQLRPFGDSVAKAGQPADQRDHLLRIEIMTLRWEGFLINDLRGVFVGLQHPLDNVGGKPVLVHRVSGMRVLRNHTETHHHFEPGRRRQRFQGRIALMINRSSSRTVGNQVPRANRHEHDLGEPQEDRNGYLGRMIKQCIPGG